MPTSDEGRPLIGRPRRASEPPGWPTTTNRLLPRPFDFDETPDAALREDALSYYGSTNMTLLTMRRANPAGKFRQSYSLRDLVRQLCYCGLVGLTDSVPCWSYRYASCVDYALLLVGGVFSLLYGFITPIFILLVADLSDAFISAEGDFGECFGPAPPAACNSTSAYGPDQFGDDVNTFVVMLAIMGVYALIVSYLQMLTVTAVSERQVMKIKKEYVKALFRQELGWFEQRQSGEITSQFFEEIERVRDALGEKYGYLLINMAQVLGSICVCFYLNVELALINLFFVAVSLVTQAVLDRMLKRYSMREQELNADAASVAGEVVSCMRTVHCFNGQMWEVRRYTEALAKARHAATVVRVWSGVPSGLLQLTFSCVRGFTFWYGAVLTITGRMSGGDVMGFVILTVMMAKSMSYGLPLISLVQAAIAAATPVFEVIDRVPEMESGARKLKRSAASVVFRNVSFAYPSRPLCKVLDDFSLTVGPGETVAIVGESGSGKSTVCKLLLRLYDVTSGEVRVGDYAVKSIDTHSLRQAIGVVQQEPVLFNDTILENLRFGAKDVPIEHVTAALRIANAADYIEQLPQGYDTPVGDRGAQLSGGQKQRIAIARALVRKPRVLILDEATSALDVQTEKVLQQALKQGADERVTIIIAHRLATVRNAAKIVVMGGGRVLEVGTHEQLVAAHGAYFDLVQSQHFAADDGQPADETADDTSDVSRGRSKGPRSAQRAASASRAASLWSSEKRPLVPDDSVPTYGQLLRRHRPPTYSIIGGLLTIVLRCIAVFLIPFAVAGGMKGLSKPFDEMAESMKQIAVAFAAIGVFNCAAEIFLHAVYGLMSEAIGFNLKVALFDNIVRQDMAYLDEHPAGEVTTRFSQHAPNVKRAFDHLMGYALSGGCLAVALFVLVVIISWQMMLFLILVLLLTIPLKMVIGKMLAGTKGDNDIVEQLGKTLAEAVDNVATVKAMTCERSFYRKIEAQLWLALRIKLRQTNAKALIACLGVAAVPLLLGAVFWFGAYLIRIGQVSPTGLLLLLYAFVHMSGHLTCAAFYFPEWRRGKESGKVIARLLEEKPTIDACSSAGSHLTLDGRIQFDDVAFSYPTRPDASALGGIKFTIKPGTTVALVGASGCGKSTVVSLVERFYDPTAGRILLDGVDQRTLNIQHMRSQMALVSQEPVLFDCSLWDNITYGLDDCEPERVVDAARRANIHEFIAGLAEGYETRAGDKGAQLSGGQKQRVAIARCLVREPKVLLLDEATSALDSDSEKVVQAALDAARLGRTCIVVAHRLSTIQSADRILVIKNGAVVEKGTHASLLAQHGDYYDMITTTGGL